VLNAAGRAMMPPNGRYAESERASSYLWWSQLKII
jgi:hypothetical protein